MKARLLISAAAAAFAVGTAFVSAEPGGQPSGQPTSKGAPGAQTPEGGSGTREGQPKAAQPKEDTKQPKTKEKAAEPKSKDSGDPKGTQSQPQPGTDKPKAQQQGTDKPATKGQDKSTMPKEKAASPKGPAGKGAVNITNEQRTEIRQTIIKQGNGPRVTNVNFNVSIGAEVPRTVQVVALPPRVIEIYPEWRGYRYFIVGERIIIVEPDSLVIVFIIEG